MKIFERLDSSLPLNSEEAILLESVRAMARDVIEPNAARVDEVAEFPQASMDAINALGLNAVFIPEQYGGAGLSYTAYLACAREISKACASTGITWATNFHGMKPIVDFGSEEQKQRFLPSIAEGGLGALAITEPSAGSNATGMRTTFTPDGNDIIINGGKTFISNGDRADLYLLFGKWSGIESAKGAISVLIFEKGTPGFSVIGKEDKMGHRGSPTAAIAFEECRVPRGNLIGDPGAGLSILFGSLNKSRPSVAAHSLGIARAAFEKAITYINEREQGGKPIIKNQGIEFMIADMAAELLLAESYLWQVAALVDGGSKDYSTESSILKMRASDTAMRITEDAVQLFGGYGYCREYGVERHMRDAKINQIWEGTNQIHRGLIGKSFATQKGR